MTLPINDTNEIAGALGKVSNRVEILISGKVYDDLLEASREIVDIQLSNRDPHEIVREMVVKAIALLLQSKNKDIILRDKRSGSSESYNNFWKSK